MIIISKAGNGNKVHIYIDGEYTLTLYDDYWYRLRIPEGAEISEDELASLKEEAGFRLAYEKGVQHLSRRAHSKRELFEKLKLKYGEPAARRAIEKMEYMGYIDDEGFAEEYARYLFDIKKYDIKRISYELRAKGIDGEIASNVLKTLDNEPISRIIEMLRTKYENKAEDEKERKKLVNRFIRMGYSYRDVKSAFRELGMDI